MTGLGKGRSKFGSFIDKHSISQEDIRKETNLNKDTITKACAEDNPKLRDITKKTLASAARKLSNKDVQDIDFW